MLTRTWYEGWRHDALHALIDKNKALDEQFCMSACTWFDYDMVASRLLLSTDSGPRVEAEFQIVGTLSQTDWLWAWANPHLPPHLTVDAEQVRKYGEQLGIDELTAERVPGFDFDDLSDVGWNCTAVAVRIRGALGAYRAGDGLFLLLRSVKSAGPLQ